MLLIFVTPVVTISDWLNVVFLCERRFAATSLFFVVTDAYNQSFCEFFGVAYVNNFLSPKQNEAYISEQLFWAAEPQTAVSSSSSLVNISLNTSNQDCDEKMTHTTVDCVVWWVEWWICGWTYWLSTGSSTAVTFSSVRARLICHCCAFCRFNFWKLIFHKVV